MAKSIDTEVILRVVRGERDWRDLSNLGITISFEDEKTHVSNPRGVVAIAGPKDIAAGLIAYRSRPEDLRIWARIILSAVPFLDLSLIEQPAGDLLLDALWDAMFGTAVGEAAFGVAEKLLGLA